jgi:hypothetical protein
MASLVAISLIVLIYSGLNYYQVQLQERYFHDQHQHLKSSGLLGHGLGIIGSLLMVSGVALYMARKRYRWMARWGQLRYWLEFHIFLCTLGPIMILFHTAFKFGGIVAISFWSMVAVFLSGIVGRFIYIQIPRSIEGRALSLDEVRQMKRGVDSILIENTRLEASERSHIVAAINTQENKKSQSGFFSNFTGFYSDRKKITSVRNSLRKAKLPKKEVQKVLKLLRKEITLNRRIGRLNTMQALFRNWHVVHLPFALVMLIIMIIHIAVTLTFGYRWIF